MKLFNTLTRKIEEFSPIEKGKVGIYACGPTVYDSAHIGNLRTYIFNDLLRRALRSENFEVKLVMNLTDIDDKTIKRGEGKLEKFREIIKQYSIKFFEDCNKLNIENPDVITKATEYVDKMVAFIQDLLDKGFAYKSDDGSIYFSIAKFADYGKLSGLDRRELKTGARVNQQEYTKENPADFVLWKAWDEADGEIFWDTKLGKGRPGWHLECSVMSQDVFGDTIDIHTGAIDLIFPHHENEIAQSEAHTGKKFVNFWVHGEFLLVDNQKMSKSLNNFYTLDDIIAKGFEPLDFRYLILGAHYRSKLNFTWNGLEGAKNARERLNRMTSEIKSEGGKVDQNYIAKFNEAIGNDLEMPAALAIVWELARDENVNSADKYSTLMKMDEVLGLNLGQVIDTEVLAEIIKLAEERKTARDAKDFAKSDELRDEIQKAGWVIEDLPDNNFKITK